MEEISSLAAASAGTAWLTKVSVDLVRQRVPSLEGVQVIILASILAIVFNVALSLYQASSFEDSATYGKILLQSALAVIGAIASTEAQVSARRAVEEESSKERVSENSTLK